MGFHPFGIRAWTRRLRAHTLVDRVAEDPPRDFTPVRKTRGKLCKNDFYWRSTKDYLADKYLFAQIRMRKRHYEPTQIVQNFWK